MFAIALYDNEAESEDELNFKKDDILEVIELDFEGLEGWWYCKLNNKTGLAAGNRLKILKIKQQPQQQQQLITNNEITISNNNNSKNVSVYFPYSLDNFVELRSCQLRSELVKSIFLKQERNFCFSFFSCLLYYQLSH